MSISWDLRSHFSPSKTFQKHFPDCCWSQIVNDTKRVWKVSGWMFLPSVLKTNSTTRIISYTEKLGMVWCWLKFLSFYSHFTHITFLLSYESVWRYFLPCPEVLAFLITHDLVRLSREMSITNIMFAAFKHLPHTSIDEVFRKLFLVPRDPYLSTLPKLSSLFFGNFFKSEAMWPMVSSRRYIEPTQISHFLYKLVLITSYVLLEKGNQFLKWMTVVWAENIIRTVCSFIAYTLQPFTLRNSDH